MSYEDYRGRTKIVSLIVLKYAQRRECNYSVLVLYSMKVHSVTVRSKSNTLAQHLHLGEAEKSNTHRFSIRRERATMDEEPLIRVRPPVNQHTIGEMELVPSAVGPSEIEQRCQIAKVRMLRRK